MATMGVLFAVLSLAFLSISWAYVPTEYSDSVDRFTGHFYKELVTLKKDENLVFSGLSGDIALAMVGSGSTGETKQEISQALFVDDFETVKPAIKAFFEDERAETKEENEGMTLNFANKIYVKPSSSGKLDSVSPTYRQTIENVFKGEIQQVDFTRSQETAASINHWVEQQTNNKIKDLISSEYLTSFTAAVLINTIYFKGAWSSKFDSKFTKPEDFHLADGTTVKVDMMKQTADLLYADSKDLDSKIVIIPYQNRNVQMVIILPNKVDGLPELRNKLINGTYPFLYAVQPSQVKLKMPKFKIETTIDVKPILTNLGAKRMFTPVAELGGILNGEAGVYISKAIQKAFIEVNEEGAEAAVASGNVATTRVAKQRGPEVEMKIDHPFYFAIVKKGSIIFSGHKIK